jgi:hypothetical protein
MQLAIIPSLHHLQSWEVQKKLSAKLIGSPFKVQGSEVITA